ncbi:MAG: hypothetical protein J5527_10845 [Treponema sp.]|nr:hypothetical protein [Treponema sp.]
MKRMLGAFAVLSVIVFSAAAYNPPVNGDVFYELSSPRQLTNASSVTGGALFYAGPESLITNPALTATEQRVDLNAAYTALLGHDADGDSSYGQAFQAGILMPFKWSVMSVYTNGTFIPLDKMPPLNLGNSVNVKYGLAKEITDKLNVGMNLNFGAFWGADTDFAFSANLGFLYNWGNLWKIKDFRYGASILNLGKNYNHSTLPKLKAENVDGAFPTIATLKLGAAGSFISNDTVKLGASIDLTTPMFMNVIADIGLQFSIKDMFYINIADEFNFREIYNGYVNIVPSVGISFRFTFDVKNSDYLTKNGWNQSEMSISAAWKQLYKSINAISAGVDINAGLKDKTPPVIKIMLEDDDEE